MAAAAAHSSKAALAPAPSSDSELEATEHSPLLRECPSARSSLTTAFSSVHDELERPIVIGATECNSNATANPTPTLASGPASMPKSPAAPPGDYRSHFVINIEPEKASTPAFQESRRRSRTSSTSTDAPPSSSRGARRPPAPTSSSSAAAAAGGTFTFPHPHQATTTTSRTCTRQQSSSSHSHSPPGVGSPTSRSRSNGKVSRRDRTAAAAAAALCCRYCFENIERDYSMCRCQAPLCRACLQHEILLTTGRGNHKAKCTVCKHEYDVKRIEKTSCAYRVKYWLSCVKFSATQVATCDIERFTWPHWTEFIPYVCFGSWLACNTALEVIGDERTRTERILFFWLDTLMYYSSLTVCEMGFTSRFLPVVAFTVRLVALVWVRVALLVAFHARLDEYVAHSRTRFADYESANASFEARTAELNAMLEQLALLTFAALSTFATLAGHAFLLAKDLYGEFRANSATATMEAYVDDQGPFLVHV